MYVTVVKHPTTGNVITPSSNNPSYGTFRVDSETVSMEKGFVNKNKRTAFVRGNIADLETLGLTPGKQLLGKIIRKESFFPFYEGQTPKINPTTGEVILKEGKQTYLESEFTQIVDAQDEWVGEEGVEISSSIKRALSKQGV